ncbi:MAG: PAS domain S-box protein [Pseudomonadota bacterium]
MPKKVISALSKAFKDLSAIGKLKAEVELFAQCSRDAIYRLRYDNMQYDYISPSVFNLLGYTSEELMQIHMRSLIIETRILGDEINIVDSYIGLEENRKNREVGKWQADYLMKTKDGRKIWVSDISYPWFDKKGAIIGSNGSLRDISERVLLEEKIRAQIAKNEVEVTN